MINLIIKQKKLFLIIEFFILFIILPIILFFLTPIPVLPYLWLVAFWCLFALMKDKTFKKKIFFKCNKVKSNINEILIQFIIITTLFSFVIYFFAPDKFLILVKENPLFWIALMFAYPILSVYPQELVYRVFFFHRYKFFFQNTNIMILLNALLFGYMHIIFHNWLAVLLTIAGGYIFAKLYVKTKSLFILWISHSLYGCMIFTLGLGEFFYTGTILTLAETFKF